MTSCRSVSNITYHVNDSCLLHPLVPLFIHFVEHNRHGAHKPPWVSCSLCSHYPGYLVWETSVDFIVHVSWSLWYISPKLWCLVSFTIFLNKCILLLTCTYCISPCLFVECLCMGSNKDYFELELELEIPKQTWVTLPKPCHPETEKSNMATRQPFRKWGHWKSIGSYPYT